MIGDRVRISLLGPLEVSLTHSGGVAEPSFQVTAIKLRQVLAMLAVNAGAMVSTEGLIDELWPYGPPRTVKTIVQTYVYQLRKLFAKKFNSPEAASLVITWPGGYALGVPRENIDVFEFQRLVDCGRAACDQGDACAAEYLRGALALWRGPLPVDIVHGPSLHGISVLLEEQRLEAVSLRIEADMMSNRHQEIVGELRSLVVTHRLHEPFHVRLMEALHRSGRRGEALTVYQRLHRLLNDELGLEPSSEAKKVHYEILASQ